MTIRSSDLLKDKQLDQLPSQQLDKMLYCCGAACIISMVSCAALVVFI